MHIAIEGLDGAGKTETARKVADRLNFEFVQKPLHYVTDGKDMIEHYLEIIKRVNTIEDPNFRARFYGTGNYLVSKIAEQKNIVTDRHLVSNYYWNYDKKHASYFDELVKSCGFPDITFVLYVSGEERKRRIQLRDTNDLDLKRKIFSDEPYDRIREFFGNYKMPHEIIDTSNMKLEGVVNYIIKKIAEV